MPLVIMCGIPKSGKSTKALKIKEFIENEYNRNVFFVSEVVEIKKAGFEKNQYFLDSQKEKHVRGVLKSEVIRLLGQEDVVILDSGNYIKGFRYELYCASKAVKTTQCTVYCVANIKAAWEQNTLEPYSKEVFDGLVLRFEEPVASSRWDAPLVVWGADAGEECGAEALAAVGEGLFARRAPPPNLSTQSAPLAATTFLQQVDVQAREVCDLAARGLLPELCAGGSPASTPPHLARLRRQFLVYTKQALTGANPDTIPSLFVQYLKTNLNK